MVTNKMTDPTSAKIGQDQVKEISATGEAEIMSESGIETVPGPNFVDRAELEKFMQEPIEVLVFEPMEKGQEFVVQLAVNGKNQFVLRGVPQKIRRKYVEVLARARRKNVSAMGYKDGMGEAKNTVNISDSLQYPFQVIADPNPKGPAWLRGILEEG